MRKGEDLAIRLRKLASETLTLIASMPKSPSSAHIARQLTRSATGAGANYEEARGAESRQDFIHKLRIVDKELRESKYWIGLIAEQFAETTADAERVAGEADELIAIMSASIRTALRREA